MSEYRPISLITSLVKIITKFLANRLPPYMNELVSHAQNAFIKKRCIHDNFRYVQRVIQQLSLYISKAFDSIRWPYLLEVLIAFGFSTKCCNWVSTILIRSSSSKILINGRPSQNIKYARGLRQDDRHSPLLFTLVVDPLQRIIERETQ